MDHQFDIDQIIHVDATSGNDANTGVGFAEARATVGEALTDCSDGDIILIWPGNYNEQLDLKNLNNVTLMGTSIGARIYYSTTGSAIGPSILTSPVVKLGHGCKVINLTIENTGSPTITNESGAIAISERDRCFIGGCRVICPGTAISMYSGTDNAVKDCIVEGGEYGIVLIGTSFGDKNRIINCNVKTSGWTACATAAISVNGGMLQVLDTIAHAHRDETEIGTLVAPKYSTALGVSYGVCETLCYVDRCTLVGESGGLEVGGESERANGIFNLESTVLVNNCLVKSVSASSGSYVNDVHQLQDNILNPLPAIKAHDCIISSSMIEHGTYLLNPRVKTNKIYGD